ncbi:MAG: SseB family protein [Paracoccaceae bacterium]
MTDAPSLLDQAHAAMEANTGDEAAALRFYRLLADTPLLLLLKHEAEGGLVDPRVFDLEAGPVLLAFDSAERLAAMGQGPLPYAELPGRVVAQKLAGQGVSLGLNFGSGAASETLLPPEALDWLAEMVDTPVPEEVEARPESFFTPRDVPQALHDALAFTFQAAPGLARTAYLTGVRYDDGRQGHMLAILDAHPQAEAPLAQAVTEAIGFSGLDAAEIYVTFLASDAPGVAAVIRSGILFEFPAEMPEPEVTLMSPGSDPDRPPRLR